MLRCFIFINQKNFTFTYLFTSIFACFPASFFLTYIVTINSIYKNILLGVAWKFFQNQTKKIAQILSWPINDYDLRKTLIARWATLSGRSELDFIMKTYVSSIFSTAQYQLKEMFDSSHVNFSEFTPMHMSKILENAPVQVLTQLRHWFWNLFWIVYS